jgi:hypothetical protein
MNKDSPNVIRLGNYAWLVSMGPAGTPLVTSTDSKDAMKFSMAEVPVALKRVLESPTAKNYLSVTICVAH